MLNLLNDLETSLFVQDKLSELSLGIQKFSNRWNFRCPICGDSSKSRRKARGNYYPRTNSYHCFNCGINLSSLWIISKFKNCSFNEVKKEYLNYRLSSLNSFSIPTSSFIEKNIYKENKEEKFILQNTWADLTKDLEDMIKSRYILDAPFKPKNWKFFFEKKNKRLVIPWIKNGEIVYWQERAIFKFQQPKYKFPANLNKEIFGLDTLDESFNYIFMLEGAFDSIWVKNGIAIGGTSLTDYQKSILENKIGFTLVWMFDNQWKDSTSMEKSLKIAQEKPNEKIFIWPKEFQQKDINEYIISVKNLKNPFIDKDFLKNNIKNGLSAFISLKNS